MQAMYWCTLCQTETERRVHRCGQATGHLRGIGWLDNDGIKSLGTAAGVLVAMLAARTSA